MGFDRGDQLGISTDDNESRELPLDGPVSGIFDKETRNLDDFRKGWVEEISAIVLRGSDARCRNYMKNRRQWLDKGEEGGTVSKNLIEALIIYKERRQ